MSFDHIAAEALRMPLRERALLASSLWESLPDPFAGLPQYSDEEVLQTALERSRQIESGEVEPITHDELMKRLRR